MLTFCVEKKQKWRLHVSIYWLNTELLSECTKKILFVLLLALFHFYCYLFMQYAFLFLDCIIMILNPSFVKHISYATF